ncbi:MAG: carboxypeptidase regulatory-like domain-containing protein [Gammaproteobacteria bacterium]|nr:carboxypeptidase regulatory-like domain-containing protein [Gammaproteobacteria bacterium]
MNRMSLYLCYSLVLLAGSLLLTACGGGDGDGGGDGGNAAPTTATVNSATNQEAMDTLNRALGVQYGAYADLLALFSNQGTTALFAQSVDLGGEGSQQLDENYNKIYEIAASWEGVDDAFNSALAGVDSRTSANKQSSTNGRQKGLIESSYNFIGWMTGSHERARKNVVAVLGSGDAGTNTAMTKQMYSLLKEMQASGEFSATAPLGNNEDEFVRNLLDGKLDNVAHRIHNHAVHDPDSDYGAIASSVGSRPLDIAYKEGVEGISKGVDLYKAVGSKIITSGLGGSEFADGMEKAETIIEKINDAEKLVSDPAGFVSGKIESAVEDRAKEMLVSKTGMNEDAASTLTGGLFTNVKDFVQNIFADKSQEEAASKVISEDWGMGVVSLVGSAGSDGTLIKVTDKATGDEKLVVSQGELPANATLLVPGAATIEVVLVNSEGVAVTPPTTAIENSVTSVVVSETTPTSSSSSSGSSDNTSGVTGSSSGGESDAETCGSDCGENTTGSADAATDGEESAILSAKVVWQRDSGDEALSGVAVHVSSFDGEWQQETQSDSNGQFTMTVPAGSYDVAFSHQYFESEVLQVTLPQGSLDSVALTSIYDGYWSGSATPTISGYVNLYGEDEEGNPITDQVGCDPIAITANLVGGMGQGSIDGDSIEIAIAMDGSFSGSYFGNWSGSIASGSWYDVDNYNIDGSGKGCYGHYSMSR